MKVPRRKLQNRGLQTDRQIHILRGKCLLTFQYTKLPGVLGERLFTILDEDQDSALDLKEFINGLFKIYFSSFDTKMQLCFDIYDFDHDGQISREDVRIILLYLPQVSTFLRNLEQ